jgi:hypothetical protein
MLVAGPDPDRAPLRRQPFMNPDPVKVELRYATLPGVLGMIAAHYWFVVWRDSGCSRWEVWQSRNAGGRSFGYVHCNLKPPHASVGGGPARVAKEWTGHRAEAIATVLERVRDYPYCGRYAAWPGPNSNTFVAWVLRRAGIAHRLGVNAIGKSYGKAKGDRRRGHAD